MSRDGPTPRRSGTCRSARRSIVRRPWPRASTRPWASAGLQAEALDGFDLYGCFPSSMEVARATPSASTPDDPRPLTLTGGLPYHGGPGSNYVTHALANTLDWLRAGRRGIRAGARQRLLSDHPFRRRLPAPAPRRAMPPPRTPNCSSASTRPRDPARRRHARGRGPGGGGDRALRARRHARGGASSSSRPAAGAPWRGPRTSSPPSCSRATPWGRRCT